MYEICKKVFPIEAIIQTELFVLNTLAWKLDIPTASEIIRHILACTCQDFDCSCIIENADSYAALCYLDTDLAFKKPFLLALASICCAFDKFRVREFKAEWLKIVGKEYPFDLQILDHVLEKIQIKINDMWMSSEYESTEADSPL
ncbi:unnamed protein product [Blepharisma stoltei]|uniref:Uncharacterized protein n=1 Tax=Blepharisma stoltei TaxID=1481888 RepID=A0AAU9IZ16_9CILI|nr:unnamed protein product [Blepharisma stoltei]